MGKRFYSLFLAVTIIVIASFSNINTSAFGRITSDPLAYENDIALCTRPQTLTKNAVSTFTARMNYDYKSDTTISYQYDVGYPVYACDFNSGEVINALHETATVANNDGKFSITGDKWTQTENLVETVNNFEMSFDVECNRIWNNACVYMRGSWMYLQLMGTSTANSVTGSSEKRMMLKNRHTGQNITCDVNPSGKNIRILAVDDNIKVYADGELAIDYTYPPKATPGTGPIYLTNTEIPTIYDNMMIYSLPNGNDDTYYQVDLGRKSTLSRYVNGVAEVLCEGDGLSQEKEYALNLKRRQGKVQLYADDTLLLNADIPTDGASAVECGHVRLLSSSANDTARDVHIYNSAEINIEESYVEILPTQTAIDPSLAILSQSGTSNDANITFKDGGIVSVASPSELNKAVLTTGFLSSDVSDVYIRFDVNTSRPDWTYDQYYFAGYTVYCGINNKNDASPCTAVNPDGKAMICDTTYNYYAHSVYTMEFIRSGYRVAVYYYPKGGEHTLLFEDFCLNQNVTNFSVRKQQGTLTFKNFEMYDCLTDKHLLLTGPTDGSGYVRIGNNIAHVPYGITVAKFKENMLNGNTLTLSRNGRKLADDSILKAGTTVSYNDYTFVWTVHTTYDLNGDGDIDIKDLYIVKDCVNGGGTEIQQACSDTDLNGTLNSDDITLVRNAILGGSGSLYTQPTSSPIAPANGVRGIITEGGKTLDVDVSIRNFALRDADVSAIHIDLIWNDADSNLVEGSFTDYIANKNTDIYTCFKDGKFSVTYENTSSDSLIDDTVNNIFGIDVKIPENMTGVCMDFKISELSIIYSDGTSQEIVSDNSAHIDVIEYGTNKQKTAEIPELYERTETYFTVDDKIGYEYSLDGVNWTDNPRFKHLETGKTYTVYQRISECGNIMVGDASEPLYVTLYKRGDVNTSGDRNANDLICMRQLLLGLDVNADLFAANANLDHKVDIRDLIKIKKLLVNLNDGWVDPTVRGEITIEE